VAARRASKSGLTIGDPTVFSTVAASLSVMEPLFLNATAVGVSIVKANQ
jgi:hypothetical protein